MIEYIMGLLSTKRPRPHQRHRRRKPTRSLIEAYSRSEELTQVARETLHVLDSVLRDLGTTNEAHYSEKHSFDSPSYLDPNDCPRYPCPATIKVTQEDTLNAAIRLAWEAEAAESLPSPRPPAVLNFANPRKPGGGWLKGAMAQEEALCYRSSLALSLDRRQYPLAPHEALYTPYVVVVRGDMASGHRLLRPSRDGPLPVVGVLTVAALYRPRVRTFMAPHRKQVFERDRDRAATKAKMRLALRMAAAKRHDKLVLGALGCGAFGNPPEDVAHCWLEVLREEEFGGNWWREVCFAVYDPDGRGNFEIFNRVLAGKKV
ncbi:hypothetical protein Hte_005673 [Hypoxylon texense]